MCGICGIFNFRDKEEITPGLLRAMTETLIHRGPDDEGIYINHDVGLGHRRLSIIDLNTGHQPIANEDQSVWVVFNGEIYNFKDLREELVTRGHHFKTHSDTEVIVHLYEDCGEACFQYLRGMFAIAIWDERQQKLILGRDRVGKKPLFYYYDGSRIAFASEIKAILKIPNISREIDFEALSDYFSFLYIPSPKSIFKRIRKLLPGSYAVITRESMKEHVYWDIDYSSCVDLPAKEWAEKLLDTFIESVRLRLLSDVPLGAFLSGGVDSSSVVGLMSQLTGGPVVTSSIGFNEKEFDELEFAKLVAEEFRTEHYEQIVKPDAVNIIEKLAWHYDEPFADSSAVPTYYVSKAAKERVTVALSGDGGDESFLGYRRYYFHRRESLARALLPYGIRRPLFLALATIYPKADWAPRFLRAKTTLKSLAGTNFDGYFISMSAFDSSFKNKLFHEDLRSELHKYDSSSVMKDYYDRAKGYDAVTRIQYVDMKTYLADDILVKVDRASMANSLEVRAPILDHKFLEMSSRIPSSLKIVGTNGKYILKEACKDILPKKILMRKKMGFSIPLARWFRKDLKDVAYALIVDKGQNGLFNASTIERLWNEHQSGYSDHASELWALVMFRMWQNKFM
jgi:asparagine synthase (glutamine-hydrolysing)